MNGGYTLICINGGYKLIPGLDSVQTCGLVGANRDELEETEAHVVLHLIDHVPDPPANVAHIR